MSAASHASQTLPAAPASSGPGGEAGAAGSGLRVEAGQGRHPPGQGARPAGVRGCKGQVLALLQGGQARSGPAPGWIQGAPPPSPQPLSSPDSLLV